jgi:hypothetical protein
MLGKYQVAAQLVASRVVLSSTELVIYDMFIYALNKCKINISEW